MKLKIVYEDNNALVIDKPAGIIVFSENKTNRKTLIDGLIKKHPELRMCGVRPRYGVVHRLDKDTSGVLLVAKNNKALKFFQKQFKLRLVVKNYLALVAGNLKKKKGIIESLIGRSPKDRKKQKAYLPFEPGSERKRKAVTEYKILEKFQDYTLVEVSPRTGRKHQIRCHFAWLGHPIIGDKMYSFKNQPCPKKLKRQFLHANYLKITLPSGEMKEFTSDLSEDLGRVLENLN